ncbi:MAG: hypothetical protein ACRDCG_00255 [Mycoplasmoidaceae bacterium]
MNDNLIHKITLKRSLTILQLINKYFWKSKLAPIMSLLLPLCFIIINYLMSESFKNSAGKTGDGINRDTFVSALPGIFSLSILPLILLVLPQMHVDFKKSVILRKIKVNNFKKFYYIFLVSFYFTIMSILFSLITLVFFSIFRLISNHGKITSGNIDWAGTFYGLFWLILSGISIGFFIGIFFSRVINSLMTGIGILFISMALAGNLIPTNLIANIGAYKYILLAFPLNYSMGLINNAILPTFDPNIHYSIFNLNHGFSIQSFIPKNSGPSVAPTYKELIIYAPWQKGLNLFMPIFITAFFTFFNLKFFKWSSI